LRSLLKFGPGVPEALFCAAVFVTPWPKVGWRWAHGASLADVVTMLFVAALLIELWRSRERRVPRIVLVLLGFCAAFLVVYLAALPSVLETTERTQQFAKGFVRFGLHGALLIGGVFVVLRRGRLLFDRGLLWLCAGISVGAVYAGVQLTAERAGFNLDRELLTPLTGVPARTLTYGIDQAPDAHRATGLTTDPNHLGVMLLVPILILAAVYPDLRPRRVRLCAGAALAGLLIIQAATLSRSALVGSIVGVVVLVAIVRRRSLVRLIAPVAAALVALTLMAAQNPSGYERIVRARLQANSSSKLHFRQYEYVPRALRSDPLFGVGLNNFALEYRPTGKKDFGPHSYYVQVLTESGLVGSLVAGVFLCGASLRLRAAAGGALTAGLAAAFAATIVANVSYLTMTFYYFFAFLVFVFAAPQVLRR
jgi:hypothetical protein